MKKILALVLITALYSCKTSQATVAEGSAETSVAAAKIIKSHYQNKKDFQTLYIKADARYEDDKQTQNVSAEIKIKKDQMILVSIRFLGITMAKALITPTQVKYYEKINGKYFEGDYTTLSQWLGTDLDYMKVQNMLTGEAMDDLQKGKYIASIAEKLHKLESASGGTTKTFFFESEKFLVKKQEIIQPTKYRSLVVNYPKHTEHKQAILPAEITIEATQQKGKTNINIDYNSVTFNEEFSFPYSVPEGYERIYIK
ncbi:MAG TPA: DUF4292 domain-containing protein [Flavobacterium sp.]|jgi:hypothetical protein|nr:DUF4292 domain-containing protein [Flavobacterium sp.]